MILKVGYSAVSFLTQLAFKILDSCLGYEVMTCRRMTFVLPGHSLSGIVSDNARYDDDGIYYGSWIGESSLFFNQFTCFLPAKRFILEAS